MHFDQGEQVHLVLLSTLSLQNAARKPQLLGAWGLAHSHSSAVGLQKQFDVVPDPSDGIFSSVLLCRDSSVLLGVFFFCSFFFCRALSTTGNCEMVELGCIESNDLNDTFFPPKL